MAAPAPPPSLQQRLERKATFEAGVKELTQLLATPHGPPPLELVPLDLVPRVHALLKARYSNPGFWRAGLALFNAAQASGRAPPALASRLPAFIRDAEAFLAAGLGPEDGGGGSQQQTLGELLLGLPPPQPAPSHLSDAGLVLEQPPAGAASAAAAAAGAAAGAAGAGPEQQQPPSVQELLQRLQQYQQRQQAPPDAAQQQQGQEEPAAQQQGQEEPAAQQPDEALLLEMLAAQLPRAELEALLSSMTEQQAAQPPSSRPAASKAAVARLPVLELEQSDLDALGGPGTACPVCTCELALRERVQKLPCRHTFHVQCLAPWLARDNSCPVCRAELPTDDHGYETRKERAAEEAEARAGAANALSHNEFAYI